MKNYNNNDIKYKTDAIIKQVRMNIFTILYYIFLLWFWQFSLSFQSSMYSLMNFSVFLMWGFGALGVLICKEDREVIIKHTKSQITYYLVVTWVYDMFLKIVLSDMLYGASTNAIDPSLAVARQFLLVISTTIKIGFPIAFVIWMLQKFAIFKNGISKQKQIELLRNIRINKKTTKQIKDDDSINNLY